jgi:hypothetical protein
MRYPPDVSSPPQDVIANALELPLEQRAELAAALLHSLDEDERQLAPDEVERLWAEEITRRAARARGGESVGRDASVVFAAIEATLIGR